MRTQTTAPTATRPKPSSKPSATNDELSLDGVVTWAGVGVSAACSAVGLIALVGDADGLGEVVAVAVSVSVAVGATVGELVSVADGEGVLVLTGVAEGRTLVAVADGGTGVLVGCGGAGGVLVGSRSTSVGLGRGGGVGVRVHGIVPPHCNVRNSPAQSCAGVGKNQVMIVPITIKRNNPKIFCWFIRLPQPY